MRQLLCDDARAAVDYANTYAKNRHDKKLRPWPFNPGDVAYLLLHKGHHPLRQPHRKWSQRGQVPLERSRPLTPLTYRLNLQHIWEIHGVISVAQLTLAKSSSDPYQRIPLVPPTVVEGTKDQWEISKLVKRRTDKRGRHEQVEYIVCLKGSNAAHDQWIKR
jgi:hypothetical protein